MSFKIIHQQNLKNFVLIRRPIRWKMQFMSLLVGDQAQE